MKRCFLFSFIMVFSFFAWLINVNAETIHQVKLNYNAVGFRAGPGTGYDRLASLAQGSTYDLLDTNEYPNEGGCNKGWYKINVNGQTGYVCGEYVSIIEITENTTGTASTSCETEMQNAGFPSSYWGKLCSLKTQHPSWVFKAIKTNLDFSSAVKSESACGLSYVQTSNSEYIDNSCNNIYGASSSWKPASQKAVAYYMDPRNFLSDKYIFQFEYLQYDNSLSSAYVSGAASILKNAHFYQTHSPSGTELATVINNAGKDTNVNPIFLSSRMLQELGNSNAEYNLYSGIYTGNNNAYYGYYNFFNFGVSDSCANTNGIAYCGLSYAKNNGWNSPYNAIKGASSILSSSYISVGQYTSYLQKYNVVPTNINRLYLHQYMTNIAAPSSEAVSSYNTYNNLSLLNSAFVFYIPVYNNMNNTITNTGSGANTSANTNTPVSSSAISTIVTASGYSYSSNYISKVAAGTSVYTLKSSLEAVSGSNTVTITNKDGSSVSSGNMATGYKVTIKNKTTSETLNVVVKGDTSGDGQINALDLLQVQKNILGTYSMSGANNLAGDTSGDGQINALDLLQVQKSILGTYTIG